MALSKQDKIDIEKALQGGIENDILHKITDGTLPNDVFNQLTNSDNNYFLDCQPTGASADEIQTYNVPINSVYTQDAARLDIYKTLVNLCLVIIFMIITYFTVPIFYKYGVVDVINKMFEDETGEYNNRLHRITTVDIILSFWMLAIIFYFLALSFSQGLWSIYTCVILTVVYVLSMVVIDGKKKEDSFMTTIFPGKSPRKAVSTIYKISDDDKIDYFKNVSIFDFGMFIVDGFKFMFGAEDISKKQPPQVPIAWFGIIGFYLFIIGMIKVLSLATLDDKFFFGILPFGILIPIIVWFCLLFDYGTEFGRKHGTNVFNRLGSAISKIPGTS
uniref:Uncharacterized protein n=1 Tax=viral metagenome TaxID=1070528 RepID=A0A6C0DQH7_9ZZZZ